VGTRGSALALWQTEWVVHEIQRHHPDALLEIQRAGSPGDRMADVPLARSGERGLFTRDLDDALIAGRIDLAVHSLKDIPVELPAGIVIGAIPARDDPRDVLVVAAGAGPLAALDGLPREARVGTDSLRRAAQLVHLRPDLRITAVRGNVDTRLRKLDGGGYDALVLAAAGLRRLGLGQRISLYLPPEVCLSAPGQGALAITVRGDDEALPALLAPLHDADTAAAVGAERALLRLLGGGCQAPLAALALNVPAPVDGATATLWLRGVVASEDGKVLVRGEARGPAARPEAVAQEVARTLMEQGAGALLVASGRGQE
jgi:hydroxymethylbilane synthase